MVQRSWRVRGGGRRDGRGVWCGGRGQLGGQLAGDRERLDEKTAAHVDGPPQQRVVREEQRAVDGPVGGIEEEDEEGEGHRGLPEHQRPRAPVCIPEEALQRGRQRGERAGPLESEKPPKASKD